MRKNVRWFLPATAALGLLVGLSTLPARAADEKAAGKGAVAGTVVDKDGKAVADVKVMLFKPRRGPGGPGGGPPPAEGRKPADQAEQGHRATGLQSEPPSQGRPPRPEPVATATTDKDGKFEMKDVPAGDYMVGVRDEDKKVFGGARVTVKDGETASVEIKTSDKPLFGRGGQGGGGQGGRRGPHPGNGGGEQQK